jgi:hypothetical protein
VITDVEATTAIRQAEVGAAKTMLDRTAEQFEVAGSRLVLRTGAIGQHLGLSAQASQLCLRTNGARDRKRAASRCRTVRYRRSRGACGKASEMREIAKPEALLGEPSRLAWDQEAWPLPLSAPRTY